MIDKLLASVFLVVFAADDDFARADVKPFQQRLDLFDIDDGRFKDQPVAVASDGRAEQTGQSRFQFGGGFVFRAVNEKIVIVGFFDQADVINPAAAFQPVAQRIKQGRQAVLLARKTFRLSEV